MDNVIKLNVKAVETVEETKKELTYSTNPIYKNMLKFHHSKIGEKMAIKDLLR